MSKRDNHYEAAFEAWLRWLRVPYVAVDESHRAASPSATRQGRTLKSLDFIVSCLDRPANWLIDVKGRQFPTAGHQFWRNWSTLDELESLAGWEELFGSRSAGLLVFAYNVVGNVSPLPADELFVHYDSLYGFVGIRLDHYASFAQRLSPRWGTVTVPVAQFRSLARPVRELLGVPLSTGMAVDSTRGFPSAFPSTSVSAVSDENNSRLESPPLRA
jgi:hypothetical protein